MANVCAQTTIGKLSAYLLVVHTNLLTLQHKLSIQRARYGYMAVYHPDKPLANELYRYLHVREALIAVERMISKYVSPYNIFVCLILTILISTFSTSAISSTIGVSRSITANTVLTNGSSVYRRGLCALRHELGKLSYPSYYLC